VRRPIKITIEAGEELPAKDRSVPILIRTMSSPRVSVHCDWPACAPGIPPGRIRPDRRYNASEAGTGSSQSGSGELGMNDLLPGTTGVASVRQAEPMPLTKESLEKVLAEMRRDAA
jgi:hypothetical protein